MNATQKPWPWRQVGFIAVILAMIGLVVWGAATAWQTFNQLEQRLATVQQRSVYFADRLQQSVLRMNNLMLRYQMRQQAADWQEFEKISLQFSLWMQDKESRLPSEEEQRILNELELIYADFLAAAHLIRDRLNSNQNSDNLVEASRLFESQSQKVFAKASELAAAQRTAQQRLLAEFSLTLSQLQIVVVAALLMMVAGGYLMARSVYKDTIAPLRQELVQSRTLLERQQKLASLGVLAAGVAHEIRNPLTAIKARVFTLRRSLKGGSREQADAEVIDQEINRLERIVKDFLLFARPSDPQLERLPAAQPLEEIARLMRPQIEKADLQLVVETTPELAARMDLQQIKQVLINLVQNAAEATSAGGRIILRTRRLQAELGGTRQDAVSLEVEDTGRGISEEEQKHLFDPFFSTKEGGTGLGLSIAARMVEKHGGVLHYHTRVNHGTRFAIILPESKSA